MPWCNSWTYNCNCNLGQIISYVGTVRFISFACCTALTEGLLAGLTYGQQLLDGAAPRGCRGASRAEGQVGDGGGAGGGRHAGLMAAVQQVPHLHHPICPRHVQHPCMILSSCHCADCQAKAASAWMPCACLGNAVVMRHACGAAMQLNYTESPVATKLKPAGTICLK